MEGMWRYDTQYNDTEYNDIQHNDTQHNDTQQNSEWNAIFSIVNVGQLYWAFPFSKDSQLSVLSFREICHVFKTTKLISKARLQISDFGQKISTQTM